MQQVVILGVTVQSTIDPARLIAALEHLSEDVHIVEQQNAPDVDLHAIIRKLKLSTLEPMAEELIVELEPGEWSPDAATVPAGGVNCEASDPVWSPITKQHYQARADPEAIAHRRYFKAHQGLLQAQSNYQQAAAARSTGKVNPMALPFAERAAAHENNGRLLQEMQRSFSALISAKQGFREAADALGALSHCAATAPGVGC